MNCPICGKEMVKGRISHGDHAIDWLPEGEPGKLFEFSKPKNGVRLNSMFSHGVCAYNCNDCRKIIIDY